MMLDEFKIESSEDDLEVEPNDKSKDPLSAALGMFLKNAALQREASLSSVPQDSPLSRKRRLLDKRQRKFQESF